MNWWYARHIVLMGRLQRFCHWSERTFGISATRWSELFYAGSLASCVVAPPQGHWWHGVLNGCISIAGMLLLPRTRRLVNELSQMGVALWSRVLAVHHLMLLCVGTLSILPTALHGDCWFLFLSLATVFLTCSDLPPGRSRVRAWLDRLFHTPQEAHARQG